MITNQHLFMKFATTKKIQSQTASPNHDFKYQILEKSRIRNPNLDFYFSLNVEHARSLYY